MGLGENIHTTCFYLHGGRFIYYTVFITCVTNAIICPADEWITISMLLNHPYMVYQSPVQKHEILRWILILIYNFNLIFMYTFSSVMACTIFLCVVKMFSGHDVYEYLM